MNKDLKKFYKQTLSQFQDLLNESYKPFLLMNDWWW